MIMKSPGLTRRAAVLSGAVTGAAVLAACGGAAPQGTASSPSKGPVTLNLMLNANSVEEMLDARVPAFTAKFPNVTVQRDLVPGADYLNKLQTVIASDELPDVAWLYTSQQWYHRIFAAGAFTAVDELVARDKVDLKQWYPFLVDAMRVDGKLGGLPFKGQIIGTALYWNKALFQDAGLKEPTDAWTYDDLLAAAAKLTKRDGNEVTQFGISPWTFSGEYGIAHVRSFDADLFTPDGKTWKFTDQKAIQSLDWYATQAVRQRTLGLPQGMNQQQALSRGKLGMIFRGWLGAPANLANLAKDDPSFRWGMTLTPKGPGGRRGGVANGDTLSITRGAKDRAAAWELLKWLTDKESGVALALQSKGSLTPGGRPDVYTDPRLVQQSAPGLPAEVGKVRSEVMALKEDVSMSGPANLRGTELSPLWDQMLAAVASGKEAPSKSLIDNVARDVNALLSQPRLTVG
jgi:multiple sugar transport system substrate-binding protein